MILLPIRFEHEILGPRPWLNWALGLASVAVFFAAWLGDFPASELALSRDSAPWTWLSHGFVHASLLHLGGNLLYAWIFGNTLERQLGPARFALLYASGLIIGGAAQLAWSDEGLILGASGALYTLVGFEIARHPRRRVRFVWWFVFRWGSFFGPVWLLPLFGGVFELLAWMGGNRSIGTAAHVGGLIAGLLIGKAVRHLSQPTGT